MLTPTLRRYLNGSVSNQQVFDYTYLKIKEQNKQSIGSDGHCKYRGENNTKCIIGMLIPDSQYKSKYDVVNENLQQELLLHSILLDFNSGPFDIVKEWFLSALQDCHDYCNGDNFAEDFKAVMLAFAKKWKLDTKVIENNG